MVYESCGDSFTYKRYSVGGVPPDSLKGFFGEWNMSKDVGIMAFSIMLLATDDELNDILTILNGHRAINGR